MRALGPIAILACSALLACNGVWGLDEGQLAQGGAGTGGSATGGDSAGNGGEAPGGAPATGGAGGATTSSGGEGQGGEGGGACLLETGLDNGDFALWSADGPDDWQRFAFNTMMTLNPAMGLPDGLSIVLTDVGAGAYAGIRQNGAFIRWDECVRLSGDAKKSSGMGQLRAIVTFDDDTIDLTLPDGTDFAPFSFECRPTQTITLFNFELRVDQVPEGGTVTVQTHGVAFDHVCCSPFVAPCGG